MANELIAYGRGAVETFKDTERYKARFTVKSESSNSLYMISFDAAPGAGYWTCSCRGNISHGQCKHLTAIGVKGRKFGKDYETLKLLGLKG
jgi:hypothetical protein